VDNTQEDGYAARRAELEDGYRALPPAGSAVYWQQIEARNTAQRVPLEVLARCCRERHAAGAAEHAERVFRVIAQRIRPRLEKWSARVVAHAQAGMKPQLREDLEQECHMKLWREMAADGPTFLLESFVYKLDRICDHVAHSVMEQAGEWTRRDVEQPTRVPTSIRTSLDETPPGDDSPTLASQLPDPESVRGYELAEWSDLFAAIDQLPVEARAIIHGLFYEGRTQQEVADELGITDRTVRKRLQAILKDLRQGYQGGQNGQEGKND
jgi:RNA polymerase sigma factor (sigma-70 family)